MNPLSFFFILHAAEDSEGLVFPEAPRPKSRTILWLGGASSFRRCGRLFLATLPIYNLLVQRSDYGSLLLISAMIMEAPPPKTERSFASKVDRCGVPV